MTNQEFSDQFSTMLNSYGSIAEFGEQASRREIVLDEYEKSSFLTQAQDLIVKSYYDRTLNNQGQGFDDSARRQVDYSSLTKVVELSPYTSTGPMFDDRGILFQLPRRDGSLENTNTDVLFILNEKLLRVKVANGNTTYLDKYTVRPISFSEYDREMTKAYGRPLKRQAWRLFQNQATGFDMMSEVIPREDLGSGESWKYRIRYVKRPRPIVLETLTGGVSIDGITAETSCELNPVLHMDILLKAVELAQISRSIGQPAQRGANQPQQ